MTAVEIIRESFPHGRGGGPEALPDTVEAFTFSPRAWGWTERHGRGPLLYGRFPHGRGGGPLGGHFKVLAELFSPRAWGWTAPPATPGIPREVFPTGVGVDR